ncbi:nucleoid-associated protein [Cupriavidus taiwanensis]|uniref:nucleoid-associated protein n=1 Tax=Cupriavidus taiwanensis TaxID=164546 RepID=UPI001558A7C1|nr:nucleoid-associated protein [Cupriavidus taiwanensis]
MLKIDRLAVHDVHPRSVDQSYVKPTHRPHLVKLPVSGMDMFNRRIAQALGHKSRGVRADFRETAAGTFFQDVAGLMHGDDKQFIDLSMAAANRLAKAQLNRDYAPSKMIVLAGTVTNLQRPFAAVVKADMQDALGEKTENGKTVIDYLEHIFLTESQRLFKIGFVQQTTAKAPVKGGIHDPQYYSVHLFDHIMTSTESRKAAYYFYGDFLGADVSATDKRLTKDFFEKTNRFFDTLDIPRSRRIDLGESLRAELRSNINTIGVASFGEKHLKKTEQAAYLKHMEKSGFPTHEITKDTDYIASKLKRRRKMVFTSGVVVTTPAEGTDWVSVENTVDGTTIVKIKGSIASEE